jgi:hypothetical protein
VLIIPSSWGSQRAVLTSHQSPAAPFKCCFLNALCTPLAFSQYYSRTKEHLPCAMDPSASSAAAESSSAEAKHRGRPLGSRNKLKVPAIGVPGAGGPLRIGAPAQGMENLAAPGTSRALTLRGPAPGGALAAPSPLVSAMPAPCSAGSIDRRTRRQGPSWAPFHRSQTPRCHQRWHPS